MIRYITRKLLRNLGLEPDAKYHLLKLEAQALEFNAHINNMQARLDYIDETLMYLITSLNGNPKK
jgi:hypothetical protein